MTAVIRLSFGTSQSGAGPERRGAAGRCAPVAHRVEARVSGSRVDHAETGRDGVAEPGPGHAGVEDQGVLETRRFGKEVSAHRFCQSGVGRGSPSSAHTVTAFDGAQRNAGLDTRGGVKGHAPGGGRPVFLGCVAGRVGGVGLVCHQGELHGDDPCLRGSDTSRLMFSERCIHGHERFYPGYEGDRRSRPPAETGLRLQANTAEPVRGQCRQAEAPRSSILTSDGG